MKAHLHRLLKSTSIYGLGQVFNRALGFFLLPVFTAYLTPADYGIYGLLTMVSFFLVPVFSLGLGTSIGVCYFDTGGRIPREATIGTAFLLLAFSSALLCAGGIFFAQEISLLAFQAAQHGYLVALTLFSAALGVLVTPFLLYLQFEEKALRFVVLTGLSSLFSVAATVAMVVGWERGIRGLMEGILLGQLFGFCLFAFFPGRRMPLQFARGAAKELLRHGLPMVPSFASLFVLQQGNRYLLLWYHGLSAVGIYTAGYNIGMAMSVLVSAFTSAWVPFFLSFAETKEGARVLFGRILTYYLLGFGFLSLLFYLYAKPIVWLMTAPSFHASYKVIGLVATSQLCLGVFSLLLPPVYFAKEVKAVSFVQLISAGCSVALGVLLISRLGVLGAALMLMLGMLLMCALQYLWNTLRKRDYFGIPYEGRRILRIGAVYAFLAFLALADRDVGLPAETLLSLACTGLLGFFAYRALTRPEREEIKKYSQALLFQR